MSAIQGLLTLVGRVLLGAIFVISAAVGMLPDYSSMVKLTAKHMVPYPEVSLGLAIAFLLVGGVSVIIGYKARFGAALLAVFLVLAAYYFHNFWTITDETLKQAEMTHFMKNLSMLGAMLFIIANGPGPWSMDQCMGKKMDQNLQTKV
jgi:putative oxidoreductase